MTREGKRTGAALEQARSAATKFGGEAAIKSLQKGEPFIGLAREVYLETLAATGIDLDALSGIDRMLVERTLQFESATRMFDNAAMAAASEGDIQSYERYLQRSGWLGNRSFNALLKVKELLSANNSMTIDGLLAQSVEGDSDSDDVK